MGTDANIGPEEKASIFKAGVLRGGVSPSPAISKTLNPVLLGVGSKTSEKIQSALASSQRHRTLGQYLE